MIPGSYANGFAPRDGEPEYPLWDGCVGSWAPCLGPTGSVLRDWSGRARHGVLTNMTLADAWTVNGGRYCLGLDGANDYVALPNDGSLSMGTGDWSVTGWIYANAFTAPLSEHPGFIVLNGAGIIFANGYLTLLQDSTGRSREAVSLPLAGWHHIAATRTGTTYKLYRDGVDVSSSINDPGWGLSNIYRIGSGYTDRVLNGFVDDVRLYNRVLAADGISLLYSGGFGRGIAYAMRERRRVRSAARIPSGATMTGGMYVNQCGGMVA